MSIKYFIIVQGNSLKQLAFVCQSGVFFRFLTLKPDPKLKQLLIRDSSKEHWRLWMLKKYMLPYLYWNKMMKGENV